MYRHDQQYRCNIVRGRSKIEMDNLLPAYAKIVNDLCPSSEEKFDNDFNSMLRAYLPLNTTEKALNNHRTEIVKSLFGMYYVDKDKIVNISDRTLKYLSDNDQPSFFKDVCYKMQFPNGFMKPDKLLVRVRDGINVRPYSYVLKVMQLMGKNGTRVTKDIIGYYVLNNIDVLRGVATPDEIVAQITYDLERSVYRRVNTPGKAYSYDNQHINELLNYLELANLVIFDNRYLSLNTRESKAIELFSSKWNEKPMFDVYQFEISDKESRDDMYLKWDKYYSELCPFDINSDFTTQIESLVRDTISTQTKRQETQTPGQQNAIELGDDGEMYVFEFEKQRVKEYDPRLVSKVIHLGKTKGLGYDLQSVRADGTEFSEFVQYIEVKTTKRVTEPDFTEPLWFDTVNLTRNEWVAAMQHKELFSIYRVYIVRDKVVMYVIKNIHEKEKEGKLRITPIMYRFDFWKSAVDEVLSPN